MVGGLPLSSPLEKFEICFSKIIFQNLKAFILVLLYSQLLSYMRFGKTPLPTFSHYVIYGSSPKSHPNQGQKLLKTFFTVISYLYLLYSFYEKIFGGNIFICFNGIKLPFHMSYLSVLFVFSYIFKCISCSFLSYNLLTHHNIKSVTNYQPS